MSNQPINPYAPPAMAASLAPANPDAPPYQLYSIGAITLAGFLGSLTSAFVLVAINYVRTGRHIAAGATVNAGLLVTLGNIVLAFSVPEDLPDLPFWIGHALLSLALAWATQSRLLADHELRGGKLASIWWAVGISLLIGVLLAVLAVLLVVIFEVGPA